MPTTNEKIQAMKFALSYLEHNALKDYGHFLCNVLKRVAEDHPRLGEAVTYWLDYIRRQLGRHGTLGTWSACQIDPSNGPHHCPLTTAEHFDLRIRWARWLINCLENPDATPT